MSNVNVNTNGSEEDHNAESFPASNVKVTTPLALEMHNGLENDLLEADVIASGDALQTAF